MSVTSQWEWVSINRENDISVSGGVFSSRPNWTMMRMRISSADYSGQLGETASSLSGYNGGVTETITAPTINRVTFNANTAWTLSATSWIETGFTINGSKSYTPYYGTANIPNSSKKNVAFLAKITSEVFATAYIWCVTEITAEELSSGTWTSSYEEATLNPIPYGLTNSVWKSAASAYASSINSIAFTLNYGTFTGDATASTGTFSPSILVCAADSQTYNQRSVDWYTQTQTWVYKSSWSVS